MTVRTIQEMFEVLNQASVKYVVLEDWRMMPFAIGQGSSIKMLVESRNTVVRLLSLSKQLGPSECRYQLTLGENNAHSGGRITLVLFEKQTSKLLPSRFETQLLNTVVMHENLVKVPDTNMEVYWIMYKKLFLEDRNSFTKAEVLSLSDFIQQRTGPAMRPREADTYMWQGAIQA